MMRYAQNDLIDTIVQVLLIARIVIIFLVVIILILIVIGITLELKWKREEVMLNGGKRSKTKAHRIKNIGGQSGKAPPK